MIQQLRQLLLLQKTPVWFPGPISSGLQTPAIAVQGTKNFQTHLFEYPCQKKLHVHLTKNNPLKII